MKKKLKIIIPIIIVLLIALVVIRKFKERKAAISKTPTAEMPVYTVKGVKIKNGSVSEAYKFLGKIRPDKDVEISSKITGVVKKVYFSEGDTIKKGELIAEIDDTGIRSALKSLYHNKNSIKFQIESLKSEIEAAKADLKFKKANYIRDKVLYKGKAISKEAFQQTETLYKIALKKVDTLNATLKSLNEKIKSIDAEIINRKHDLTYTKIYAEISGKVSKKFLKKGALETPGKPIIEIITDKNFKILSDIPSEIAEKITKDSYIIAEINNKKIKLPIKKIYPKSENNTLVTIETRIEKLPFNITSDSFINLKIVISSKKGLTVPKNSILSLTDGNYLLTEHENKIVKVKINKELCDEKNCIVKGKIKEGDIVATGMENKLRTVLFHQNGRIVINNE